MLVLVANIIVYVVTTIFISIIIAISGVTIIIISIVIVAAVGNCSLVDSIFCISVSIIVDVIIVVIVFVVDGTGNNS